MELAECQPLEFLREKRLDVLLADEVGKGGERRSLEGFKKGIHHDGGESVCRDPCKYHHYRPRVSELDLHIGAKTFLPAVLRENIRYLTLIAVDSDGR